MLPRFVAYWTRHHTIPEVFFGLNKRGIDLKSFIFDFDGVIADTDRLHLEAWDAAHQQLLGSSVERLTRFSGRHSNTIASILSKESGYRLRASDLIRVKQEMLISRKISCEPVPGALEFIAIIESKGIRWSVASNSNRAFVETIIGNLGLCPFLTTTAEDVRKPKPAPDLFWHCANLMGISPAERNNVIVFEDSPHGIESAVAAGMRPWGIATNCSTDTLKRAGAEQVVKNFIELRLDPGDLFT